MSSYLSLADIISSALWDMGKYYCHGLDCSGHWCVFLYTKPSKPPELLVEGLTPRELCVYLSEVYNAQAR